MNSERAGVGSESPQLPPAPYQLPPHQLLGLAGLVAGAGMGTGMPNNMSMGMGSSIGTGLGSSMGTSMGASMGSSMANNSNTSPSNASPSNVARVLPPVVTSAGGVTDSLMPGVAGPSRPPPLPPGLMNMNLEVSPGMPWGSWADLQDSMGMERGRSRNWTYEETLELITLYTSDEWQAKFSSEKKNHRAIWAGLAGALTRRKDVSGDEARQRLNNLKALYNRTRRQLLAGEISSPQWEYWEPLHAFLGRPQPYIPITTSCTPPRPPPLHGFHQHQFQPQMHHHHPQGLLGALGLSPQMHHPRGMPPRPMFKTSPDMMNDDSKEGLPGTEERGTGEFGQGGEDMPVSLSPEQFLSEASEREPTPAPPTPTPPKPVNFRLPESYQLRHNNHLTIVLEALARDEAFMDVTLTAQGRSLKAHKSVLSAVSPYFRGVLRDNPCQHPIIIMPRDVRFEELYSIVNYIYKGEMTVAAEDLTSLLKTAEILQVSGLAPSDSTATVNPSTESCATGNVRSSSASSSSSSSTHPPGARTVRPPKPTPQGVATPPARPKSRDCMINPTDFMDVDMTCVKEEVASGGEEEDESANNEVAIPPPANESGKQDEPQETRNSSPTIEQETSPTVPVSQNEPSATTATPTIKAEPGGSVDHPQANIVPEDPIPFMCPHCQEIHRSNEMIMSHLRLKHPSKPSFVCGCGRVFVRQLQHQAHTRVCSSSS
ncbi:protein bric-a-brac 2-like isoform X1 [Penaeus chinensis]|uniref:protein bric-a-brac 2-like isoform X1 n=1 Tax=Penaeus chinensis TaxID=139456 RepID=UPI001FB765B8|nr:protein bric-a-brac 2-like isoform X1 [Penaeus chinensis]